MNFRGSIPESAPKGHSQGKISFAPAKSFCPIDLILWLTAFSLFAFKIDVAPVIAHNKSQKIKPEARLKAAFLQQLRKSGKLRNASIISELIVGKRKNRADIVIANGKLRCFELKTAQDSLDRLPYQIDAYTRCFTETTVVAATRHIKEVFEICPEYVGVMEAIDNGNCYSFVTHRVSSSSKNLCVDGILELLPLPNIKILMDKNFNRLKREDLIKHARQLNIGVLNRHLLNFLKKRYKISTENLIENSIGRQILANDLSTLRIWTNEVSNFDKEKIDLQIADDWETYLHIGKSFGSVPQEIEELMET